MQFRNVGLLRNDPSRATKGLTLFSPIFGKETLLIGMDGDIRHVWQHPLKPGKYAHLLPSGNLLWSGETEAGPHPGGGKGGLLREYDWDGNVIWEYQDDRQHHDVRRLANGNTLYVGWEPMPEAQMQRVTGAEAGSEDDGVMWGDFLREVDMAGNTVWEWHLHEHVPLEDFPLHPMSTRKEFAHCNAISELPNGNILMCFRKINTIMIIDRSSGGVVWHHRDDMWGQQHDAQMLANGNILLFANGVHVPRGILWSRIVELNSSSRNVVWSYAGSPKYSFFSPHISGVGRLRTGNTLICEGVYGRMFEVTPEGETVWEYVNPRFAEDEDGSPSNSVFRAYRYDWDSPEVRKRVGRP